MAFSDTIRTLANQIEERRKHVATEEAVKQALILPFIGALGFDIYNPAETIPEYRAGWAKNNEKVDYCIQLRGKPVLFIEAKGPNEALASHDSQLAKYFNATPEVKFAMITNGIQYRFFTDLQDPNILDKKPFFEFAFDQLSDADLAVLERFRKDVFNAQNLAGYAEDLVYLDALKAWFKKLLREPSDEFVSFAVKDAAIVETRVTQRVIDRFRALVAESTSAAVLELVQQSLLPQAAAGAPPQPVAPAVENAENSTSRIVTTPEEQRAFNLIHEMVASHVPDAAQVRPNDTESYFSVIYRVPTRWFIRMRIQDREKKLLIFRLPLERCRELAPTVAWEVATGSHETARTEIDSVEALADLGSLLIEAVKDVAG